MAAGSTVAAMESAVSTRSRGLAGTQHYVFQGGGDYEKLGRRSFLEEVMFSDHGFQKTPMRYPRLVSHTGPAELMSDLRA